MNRQKRTDEEIQLILPAFNSNRKPGLLKNLVLRKRRENKNVTINVDELIEKYAAFDCLGVVRLIKLLQSDEGRGAQQIGSGTIDLSGGGPDEYFAKILNGGSTCGLYIGEPKVGLTPIQWLSYLAEGLRELIPEQIKAFDEICGDLAVALVAPTYPIEDI